MPRPSATLAHAMATALSTSASRQLLDGGFETFTGRLRDVQEWIRVGVHGRWHAHNIARGTLYQAFVRRRDIEPRRSLQVLAGGAIDSLGVDLLVSYHGRCGALDVANRDASLRLSDTPADRELFEAGLRLLVHVYPEDITDHYAADKVVDRFLRDLAAS